MANWFYVQDGNRVGPVSEEQLKTLYQAGAIEGESLIWQKGLKEWVKYDVQFPPPPGAKKPEKKDKPKPKPQETSGGGGSGPALSPSAATSPGAAKPPPPPPEAYEGGSAGAEAGAQPPETASRAAQAEAPAPVPEPRVPKPIPSKGTEERWKTMGPTFQLAEDRRRKAEEKAVESQNEEDEENKTIPEAEAGQTEESQATAEDQAPSTVPPPMPVGIGAEESKDLSSVLPESRDSADAGAQLKLEDPENPGDISVDGPSVERAICHDCQKPFPVSMMDKFGRRWVCKLCQARQREKYEQEQDRKRGRKGMFSGTFEKVLLVLAIVGLLGTIGWAIKGRLANIWEDTSAMIGVNITSKLPPTSWVNKPLEDWPPIVMANYATFAESSHLQGGSAFLVRGNGNQEEAVVVGATSSTLLDPDFGVYPPVHPATIPMVLGDWKMFSMSAPDKVLRFSQLYEDPFAYLVSPVVYLEPAHDVPVDFPVEILQLQTRNVQDGEFVYVVTIQPRRERFTQTIYEGVAYVSEGDSGMNIMVELDETVSDMEVPGAPMLDANGHVVGMIIGSRPFQGHMPIEEFEQVLYNRETTASVQRRRDVRQVQRLYAADLRVFPKTLER